MRNDPKRWSAAGSDAPEALRELLATGREQLGSAGEVESLRQRLAQVLTTEADDALRPCHARQHRRF